LTKKEEIRSQYEDYDDKELKHVIGTSVYCSVKSHNINLPYKKRDDLESMMYILSYCATGTLPWYNMHKKPSGNAKIKLMKENAAPNVLFPQLPKEFCTLFNYIKSLTDNDIIEYNYMKELLK